MSDGARPLLPEQPAPAAEAPAPSPASELLQSLEEMTREQRDALVELARTIDRANTLPAALRTFVLTASEPIQKDDVGDGLTALSVGVINPTAVTVYLGVGGIRPQPGSRAVSVAPLCALVLPVGAQDFELGADPADLAAGDAVVWALRFPTVQPFFMGSIA